MSRNGVQDVGFFEGGGGLAQIAFQLKITESIYPAH